MIIAAVVAVGGVLIIMLTIHYLQNQPCGSEIRPIINTAQNISGLTLDVPLNVIIASGETKVSYNDSEISHFVEFSNDVWNQAGIRFYIKSIQYIAVPEDRAMPPRDGIGSELCKFGRDFLGTEFEDAVIDVVIIKNFVDKPNGGGRTLNQGIIGAIFINEFDDDYRANWTLSHELGHVLNLNHMPGKDNLMFNADLQDGISEERSTTLTSEQVEAARNRAYAIHCPGLSCVRD